MCALGVDARAQMRAWFDVGGGWVGRGCLGHVGLAVAGHVGARRDFARQRLQELRPRPRPHLPLQTHAAASASAQTSLRARVARAGIRRRSVPVKRAHIRCVSAGVCGCACACVRACVCARTRACVDERVSPPTPPSGGGGGGGGSGHLAERRLLQPVPAVGRRVHLRHAAVAASARRRATQGTAPLLCRHAAGDGDWTRCGPDKAGPSR